MNEHLEPSSFSKEEIRRVLGSAEGKALIRLLQQDGGMALKRAADAVKHGNTDMAQSIMKPMMESEEASRLLEFLNDKRGQNGNG